MNSTSKKMLLCIKIFIAVSCFIVLSPVGLLGWYICTWEADRAIAEYKSPTGLGSVIYLLEHDNDLVEYFCVRDPKQNNGKPFVVDGFVFGGFFGKSRWSKDGSVYVLHQQDIFVHGYDFRKSEEIRPSDELTLENNNYYLAPRLKNLKNREINRLMNERGGKGKILSEGEYRELDWRESRAFGEYLQ
jgi:hypothetical protein